MSCANVDINEKRIRLGATYSSKEDVSEFTKIQDVSEVAKIQDVSETAKIVDVNGFTKTRCKRIRKKQDDGEFANVCNTVRYNFILRSSI